MWLFCGWGGGSWTAAAGECHECHRGMNLPGQRLRGRVLNSWRFSFAHHLFLSAMVHSPHLSPNTACCLLCPQWPGSPIEGNSLLFLLPKSVIPHSADSSLTLMPSCATTIRIWAPPLEIVTYILSEHFFIRAMQI